MKSLWIAVDNGELIGVFKTQDDALDYLMFECDKDFTYYFWGEENFDAYEIKPGQNSGKYCNKNLSYEELKRMCE